LGFGLSDQSLVEANQQHTAEIERLSKLAWQQKNDVT
jgi:hypothetical protein